MQPPDPEVLAHRVRRAAEHQRFVVAGLDDAWLRVVAARFEADANDPEARARRSVVLDELARRSNGSAG